MASVTVMFC